MVADVARFNIVYVYDPDPNWYVTHEQDPDSPREFFRLWHYRYAAKDTVTLDTDELVRQFRAHGLDPRRWREPTEEEKRPRRDA
jgi:hypothetical protein